MRCSVKKNKIAKVPVNFWEQGKEISKQFGNVQGSAIEGMRILSKVLGGDMEGKKEKKKGRGKTTYTIK